MGDGHFRGVSSEKCCAKLQDTDACLDHRVPYLAGPKARKIEMKEVKRIKNFNVMKPTHIECACFIVFKLTVEDTDSFCVNYSKLKFVIVRKGYPLPETSGCINAPRDFEESWTPNAIWVYRRIDTKKVDCKIKSFTSGDGFHKFQPDVIRTKEYPRDVPTHDGRHSVSYAVAVCIN